MGNTVQAIFATIKTLFKLSLQNNSKVFVD